MIKVNCLAKEFKIKKTSGGLRGLLHPEYQTIRAVDNIDFSVEKGEMVGYIGPNGAGKSTTMKLLTSILTPTSGDIRIDGDIPNTDRKSFVRKIGAMFGQKTQLWWDLPIKDSFLLLKDMYGISEENYKKNMQLFCDVLELDKFMHQPVRQLSLGQRVRGDLAAVLLHNPKVVFLDEPTLGIDFLAKKKIREFIREVNSQRDITVMLTSHDIADIESVCNRLIIINEGKIAYDGSLEKLRQNFGKTRKIDITFEEECDDFVLPGAVLTFSENNRKIFSFTNDVSPSALISEAGKHHLISNIRIIEPEIEDIISEIYRNRGGAQ